MKLAMYKSKHSPIEGHDVHLHGWDARADSWHGPIPLAPAKSGGRLNSVRKSRGAYQGKLRCSVPGLPCLEFFTAIYDLRDMGVAIVHLDGKHGGPVGIVAVVPRNRRSFQRDDFAFELMTFVSFLSSPINRGSELVIHDYIEEVLRTEPSITQVFAVETADLGSDLSIVLSAHFEQLAAAMLDWMATREPEDDGMYENEEYKAYTAVPVDRQAAALCPLGLAV